MLRKLPVALFIFFSITYISCKKETTSPDPVPPPPGDTTILVTPPPLTPPPLQAIFYDNDNLLLGNPSDAAYVSDTNYLLSKPAYSLSYNRDKGIPNWVSWHLYSNDLGSISRQDDFVPDPDLPSGWYQVTTQSYSGSGFDRGHDCPSADRTATSTLNGATFFMTNIIPQAPNLNQGPWDDFENYTRNLISQGSEAYIIMGNYGRGGNGNYGYAATIDYGNVTVPAYVWKVVVLIPNGDDDTMRINAATRIIAVQMPNNNNVSTDWKSYRTSVDAIENETGLDLLSRLPVTVQDALEAKVDNQ